jgi:molecular chaperone HscB
MPAAFLMQQMEWREELEDASDLSRLESLSREVIQARRVALEACGQAIDQLQDFKTAVGHVRALMFIERFSEEVDARIDASHDAMGSADRGQ